MLRYLSGTSSLGLIFRGKGDGIECFPDASLGLNDREGRSTTGYAIKLFGDLVCWRSKLQTQIALSSAEAEYVAMSMACKEVVSLNDMNRKFLRIDKIPLFFEDNMAAIKLAKTEESKTLRHLVNLYHHYIRNEVKAKRVQIEWISTKEQLGDFFTKALGKPDFCKFRNEIMSSIEIYRTMELDR